MLLPVYASLFSLAVLFNEVKGFYLPGLAPVTYCESAEFCQNEVPVFVNRLTSLKTNIPYEYDSFDFCHDTNKTVEDPVLTLGQVVFGDRIRSSPYKLQFKRDVSCETVCEKKYSPGDKLSFQHLNFMKKSIEFNYQHHWIIDDMPVSWCYLVEDGNQYCSRSFPVGCYITKKFKKQDACVMSSRFNEGDTFYFVNHVDFVIHYKPGVKFYGTDSGRIIDARVEPRSIAYDGYAQGDGRCKGETFMGITGGRLKKETVIRYTYSVRWIEDTTSSWSTRWDYILESWHSNIQWFNLVNSLVVNGFLMGLLLRVLWKTLFKTGNNQTMKFLPLCCVQKKKTEFDWRLIYGDVFRPPGCGMLLAVFVGSGVQLLITTVITLLFACIGFLSPASRGSLATCVFVSYVCLGFPAGYVSARLYKVFGGKKKILNALLTGLVCPGTVFLISQILNVIFWIEGSSAALPYTTVFVLLAMWLGVSLPLSLLGSFFGFRKKSIQHTVKPNPTSRHVPKLKILLKPVTGMIFGGFLPFGCIFIQLFFILNSIWSEQVYYQFGFLALVFLLMTVCCCLVTILLCYFHLGGEDYRWWWRSFLNSGFTSVYFFIYCVHYCVTKLELQGGISIIIYIGYMLIAAFLLFLITGTIGFFACFWFVRKIYSTVKGHDMWATTGSEVKPLE